MRPRALAVLVTSTLAAMGSSAYPQATGTLQVLERWPVASGSVESTVDRTGGVSLRADGGAWRAVGVGAIRVERAGLGGRVEALIVRVEGAQPGLAVLVGGASSRVEFVHAGPTITRGEDVSDRSVTDVVTRPRPDGARQILLGQRRGELSLCGLGAPMVETRALDPVSRRWEPVTVDPLATLAIPERGEGTAIAAVPVDPNGRTAGVPALIGQSSLRQGALGGPWSELHDGRAETVWTADEGAVAVARVLPGSLPLERVILQAPLHGPALPRALTLIVGAQRLEVAIDPSLSRSGARVAIPLVPARPASCVAIIARGAPLTSGAAIAGVSVGSALDRASDPVGELVRALGEAQDDAAVEALAVVGARAVPAIAAALPSLASRGARRAVRLLASHPTPASAEALVGALARDDLDGLARDAVVRLGAVALAPLSLRVATDGRAADVILALRAERLARARALLPALSADPSVWRRARGPLRALLAECDEAEQRSWLEAARILVPRAALRAAAVLLDASRAEGVRREATTAALAVETDDFSLKFLKLSALGGSPEGVARLAVVVAQERDPDLRFEAVRALGASSIRGEQARAAIERALGDSVPRVRAEALRAMPIDGGARALIAGSLATDRWPRVRAEAAERLAGDARSADALLGALEDPSVAVVQSALAALERTRHVAIAPRLLAFARDPSRNPALRIDALGALGARCDRTEVQGLEALAVSQLDAALPEPEQRVGHAALAALARIEPTRARAVLSRMEANATARSALEVAARGACGAR
jgi:hypothetical protein